jgi:hypothetical protein
VAASRAEGSPLLSWSIDVEVVQIPDVQIGDCTTLHADTTRTSNIHATRTRAARAL